MLWLFDEALASLKGRGCEASLPVCALSLLNPATWGDRDAAAFLARRGAVLAPRQVQPSHAQIVDLSGSEDEILEGMRFNNRNLHQYP